MIDFISFYFVSLLLYGLQTNVVGILLTVAIVILFQIVGVNPRKAVSYCIFFFGGAAVAQLQWMISTEEPSAVVGHQIAATIVLVGTFSLIGFFTAKKFLKDEKLLGAIIVLTIGLAVLQFAFPSQLLNWYARFYALVCLAAPVVVFAQAWYNPREPHSSG